MGNLLYFGDNLKIMREFIKDESVDLIYLDPPFNSNASYNILFRSPLEPAAAQVKAFEDTWRWDTEAQAAFNEVQQRSADTFRLLLALKSFLGSSDVMAYLAMMAIRLVEMRRILKPTGSLYLHCDPTASHYLKILLDGIFGGEGFQNEIVWQRAAPKGNAFTRFPSTHDVLLAYRKGRTAIWNPQFLPHRQSYIESHYGNIEPQTGRRYTLGDCLSPNPDRPNLKYEWNGHLRVWRWTKDKMQDYDRQGRLIYTRTGMPRFKRYLDEMPGSPITSVWTDISPVNSQADERIGYPTQKPITLLNRIILAASNPGDVVLDPFCGCGTAIEASARLGRRWIGIDVTYVAIKVIRDRMKKHLPQEKYQVRGIPRDVEGARRLADEAPHEFQNWTVSELGGNSRGKGADRGIDGDIVFMTGRDEYRRAIISVKGGKYVAPAAIRELIGTVKRERAEFGIFICFGPLTREMRREAAEAGQVELPGGDRPRIRIVTVEELLAGANLGLTVVLDSVSSASEAKRVQAKRQRKTKSADPKQKSMMLPLKGGRSHDAPHGKSLELPLEEAATGRKRAGRRS